MGASRGESKRVVCLRFSCHPPVRSRRPSATTAWCRSATLAVTRPRGVGRHPRRSRDAGRCRPDAGVSVAGPGGEPARTSDSSVRGEAFVKRSWWAAPHRARRDRESQASRACVRRGPSTPSARTSGMARAVLLADHTCSGTGVHTGRGSKPVVCLRFSYHLPCSPGARTRPDGVASGGTAGGHALWRGRPDAGGLGGRARREPARTSESRVGRQAFVDRSQFMASSRQPVGRCVMDETASRAAPWVREEAEAGIAPCRYTATGASAAPIESVCPAGDSVLRLTGHTEIGGDRGQPLLVRPEASPREQRRGEGLGVDPADAAAQE